MQLRCRWGSSPLNPPAAANGLGPRRQRACLTDPKALAVLDACVRAGAQAAATPTLFVNGRKVGEGERSAAALAAAIAGAELAGSHPYVNYGRTTVHGVKPRVLGFHVLILRPARGEGGRKADG